MNRFVRLVMYMTLALALLLFSGCTLALAGADSDPTSSDPTSASLISESEALEIAADHFGIEAGSYDEKTGYMMSYRVLQVATLDNPYYRVALQWMVEMDGNPSHQSMLDTVTIDALTGKVATELG
ncbi:MAG: hypothetical protein IJ518_07130 [Clostridia bacterium]|nr:hypothetical protein [Clostridia bacterium]